MFEGLNVWRRMREAEKRVEALEERLALYEALVSELYEKQKDSKKKCMGETLAEAFQGLAVRLNAQAEARNQSLVEALNRLVDRLAEKSEPVEARRTMVEGGGKAVDLAFRNGLAKVSGNE